MLEQKNREGAVGSNLDSALDLAARGLRVFPLIERGKTPAFAGWQDAATSDPAQITAWFSGIYRKSNVGVATGNGLMVIDADTKGGAGGLSSLETMALLDADLDFVVATPSGGRHAYFRLPAGAQVPNSVRRLAQFPGIDVRGERGLVVAPGSIVDQGAYSLLAAGDIPPAQPWLIEAAQRARKIRERDRGTTVDLDKPDAIARAVLYLKTNAPEAIEGAGGSDTAYRVACHIRDYGLSEDAAAAAMLDHWNARCSPPWDPIEIEQIVEHAFEYATGSAGGKSADAEFDEVAIKPRAEAPAKTTPAIRFVKPSLFDEEGPPSREWAVEGWIPAGKTTLVSGDGGVGKTLIAQQLLTAVATKGATWFGKAVVHGPVLGVFSEDDTNEMWRRQIDICGAMNIPLASLDAVNWWTLDEVAAGGCVLMSFTRENPEGKVGTFFKQLDAALTQLKPVMVVLDPIANMFGGNELDRAQVTGFVNRTLNRLCTRHGCTMVVLVHPSLSGMAEGSGRSGSTSWANAVRSRLYLTRPKSDPAGDYRELRPTKNNYGKLSDKVMLRYARGAFVLATGSEAEPERVAERGLLAALRILAERGEDVSPKQRAGNYAVKLAMALPETEGLTRDLLEKALENLKRAGAVVIENKVMDNRHSAPVLRVVADVGDFDSASDDDLQ